MSSEFWGFVIVCIMIIATGFLIWGATVADRTMFPREKPAFSKSTKNLPKCPVCSKPTKFDCKLVEKP